MRGQDFANASLDAHQLELRAVGQGEAGLFVRGQLRHPVLRGLHVLPRRVGRQHDHGHAQRVALAGDGVNPLQMFLDEPVRIHGARQRNAPEVRAFLVVGKDARLVGGQQHVLKAVRAVPPLFQRVERFAVVINKRRKGGIDDVRIGVPAIEGERLAVAQAAHADAVAVNGHHFLEAGRAKILHAQRAAHHVFPVLRVPRAARVLPLEAAEQIGANEVGNLFGLGRGGVPALRYWKQVTE